MFEKRAAKIKPPPTALLGLNLLLLARLDVAWTRNCHRLCASEQSSFSQAD